MLEKLISLLGDNIIFVIVAVFGIIAYVRDFFNKLREASAEQPAPIEQKQAPPREATRRAPEARDRQQQARPRNKKPVRGAAKEMDASEKLGKEAAELLAAAEAVKERSAELRRPATKKHSQTATVLGKRVTRSRLAESVIMAEILGPPRARKPHQSRANSLDR